ncbi:hypothetical protein A6R68_06700, partial [Neotoma lepida]
MGTSCDSPRAEIGSRNQTELTLLFGDIAYSTTPTRKSAPSSLSSMNVWAGLEEEPLGTLQGILPARTAQAATSSLKAGDGSGPDAYA